MKSPSETYRPYRKPNDKLLYVYTLPNHSSQIIRQLPLSIKERLCNNSSNETVFKSTKLEYQDTLRKIGYKFTLSKNPKIPQGKTETDKEISNGLIHDLAYISAQTQQIYSSVYQTSYFQNLIDYIKYLTGIR